MAADDGNMIWVTWKENRSRYDGKTHLVSRDVLIDPPTPLTVGTTVTVYWETGRKKYWTAQVAEPRAAKRKGKSNKTATEPGDDGCSGAVAGQNASKESVEPSGRSLSAGVSAVVMESAQNTKKSKAVDSPSTPPQPERKKRPRAHQLKGSYLRVPLQSNPVSRVYFTLSC